MNKTLVIAGVALALSLVALLFPRMTERVVEKVSLGAVPGSDFSSPVFARGGLTFGQNCFSTSTTGTFTAKQLADSSCIYITASGAGQAVLSLTLPATSTMGNVIPDIGMCRTWFVDASDVAAATTTTFVKGTGWNLVGLDATGAGTGADVLDGAEYGRFTACREKDKDIVGYMEEWLAAD